LTIRWKSRYTVAILDEEFQHRRDSGNVGHVDPEDPEPGTYARLRHCAPDRAVTQNVFKVNAGSLLTALQRLERNEWLDADWLVTENSRRAKVYRLTQTGRKQLQSETADWLRRSAAISRLLKNEA
jgi:hypothetical protein